MRRNFRGSALISALFITVIAVMIATALMSEQSLLIHESELILHSDQSYLDCELMQNRAKKVVAQYAMQFISEKNTALTLMPLAKKLTTVKMDNMILQGKLEDEQGKFNINNLIFSASQSQFVTLLREVMPGVSQQQGWLIAKAMTDWMTKGVNDSIYLERNPPYRSSKTIMANSSELGLVLGVTPEMRAALAPYITALPVQSDATPININSVSLPVLLATSANLTVLQAKKLIACRDQMGVINSLPQFISRCAEPLGVTTLNNLTSTSQYFYVKTDAKKAERVVSLKRLWVTRLEKNNTLRVITVWQEFE
ncbi:MAG: type II secretion system minor pseudopilin GspK [Gammaproteobacteria bacterium]|nr:type II secretion system minor pseudopilin GspK [Gammaproteobacteria bacterium]